MCGAKSSGVLHPVHLQPQKLKLREQLHGPVRHRSATEQEALFCAEHAAPQSFPATAFSVFQVVRFIYDQERIAVDHWCVFCVEAVCPDLHINFVGAALPVCEKRGWTDHENPRYDVSFYRYFCDGKSGVCFSQPHFKCEHRRDISPKPLRACFDGVSLVVFEGNHIRIKFFLTF